VVSIGGSVPSEILGGELTHEVLKTFLIEKAKKMWSPDLVKVVESPIAELANEPGFLTVWTLGYVPEVKNGWKSSRVTLLGDAVHAMPPSLGMGGNSALLDAMYFAEEISQNHSNDVEMISAFEHRMRETGYKAMKLSIKAMNAKTGLGNIWVFLRSTFFIKRSLKQFKNRKV
jgi:flavin-dependent dehydrogenase